MIRVAWFVIAASLLRGQDGLTPAWDLKRILDTLSSHSKRMVNATQDLQPEAWVNAGAPATYVEQVKSLQAELYDLERRVGMLKAEPEKMSLALSAYFRLQTLEIILDSVSQGVRRYQNPALADLMQSMIAENDVNRSRLRGYLQELAVNKEHELRIMNEEAQRCRDSIIRQPRRQTSKPKPQPAPTNPAGKKP